jgi:hypothetical protein
MLLCAGQIQAPERRCFDRLERLQLRVMSAGHSTFERVQATAGLKERSV